MSDDRTAELLGRNRQTITGHRGRAGGRFTRSGANEMNHALEILLAEEEGT